MMIGCRSPQSAPPLASPAASPDLPTLVFLGDSLTAGYGVAQEEAYPALIAERLKAEKLPYQVVNAGVSGDTTAGGVQRLEWVMKATPALAVVALGSNDGLRGLPVEETRKNLEIIIRRLQEKEVRVVLAGMKLPSNYGETYRRDFEAVYRDLAGRYHVAVIPFLLEGVGGKPEMNQADGLHPNREGHRRIAETVWKVLRPLL